MRGGDFARTLGPATVDARGSMPAAAYQVFAAQPPTDPTAPIPTTGTSGTFSEGTALTVPSSLDAISDLGYKRCHDTGHAGTGKLVKTLWFGGFATSSITQATTTMMRRCAAMVGPTGLAPLMVAADGRGRGGRSGTIDYRRDRWDRRDCLAHAVAAVGESNIWGGGTVLIGVSTGCFDAMLYACTFPGDVAVVVLLAPNFDLGRHSRDSYWAIQDATQRGTLTTEIGSLSTRSAAQLDPYMACNAIDAFPRIVARRGGPSVWVIADDDDPGSVPLPNHHRLIAALRAIPAAAAKTHVFVTGPADASGVRVRHDGLPDSAGAVLAERRYWPTILRGELTATALPPESPPEGLPVLGYVVGDDFEFWTGANASPRSDSAGGRTHAGDLHYRSREFTFTSTTSTNGHMQVVTDLGDDRDVEFTAGVTKRVDLDVPPTIATLADLKVTDAWFSDAGIAGDITSWTAEIGGRVVAPPGGAEPATAVVSGITCVRFTRTSDTVGKRLLGAFVPIDPGGDYTWFVVFSKPDGVAGQIVSLTHQGTYDTLSFGTTAGSPGVDSVFYRDSTYVGLTEVGGHNVSQNVKHVEVIRRLNGVLSSSLDGSSWNELDADPDTFPSTGTFHTVFGAGLANQGSTADPFNHSSVDLYCAAFGPAMSESEILAAIGYLKTRFTF